MDRHGENKFKLNQRLPGCLPVVFPCPSHLEKSCPHLPKLIDAHSLSILRSYLIIMKPYSSNCTLPPTGEIFVSSPNVRGTLDIVWTCLSVLLICTWSVLHLNVPIQSKCKGKGQKINLIYIRTTTKLKWLLLNLLAPEWSLAKAWSDSRSVAFVKDGFKKFAETDDDHWEDCHSHFANLGGFTISFAAIPTSAPLISSHGSISGTAGVTTGDTHPENTSTHERHSMSGADCILGSGDFTDRDALSSEEPDVPGVPLNHTDLESLSGHISPQEDENDRLQPIGSLVDQPAIISPNTSSSTRETCNFTRRASSGALSNTSAAKPDTYVTSFLIPRIKERLERSKQRHSLHSMPRSLYRLSRVIGPIEWKQHMPNVIAVVRSVNEVKIDNFETRWEKAKFLRVYRHWFRNVLALQGDRWVVDANQMLLARDLGIIKKLPSLSTEEIEDRSKADLL